MADKGVSSLYWRLVADRSQDKAVLRFLRRAGANASWRILDVGCGYGRNLDLLRNAGLSPAGVEINEGIRENVRARGYLCHAPGDPPLREAPWDALLMSHIIEHFPPEQLKEFLEGYLGLLRDGGALIIASPLPSPRFYDNFDHVKPYTPAALEEVFGLRGRQVQFQSKQQLTLVGLWLRRRAHVFRYRYSLLSRGRSAAKIFFMAANVVLSFAHAATLGALGTTDGWVGLYRKSI